MLRWDPPSMRSQCPVSTQMSTSMTESEKDSSSARVKRPQQPKEILESDGKHNNGPGQRGGGATAAVAGDGEEEVHFNLRPSPRLGEKAQFKKLAVTGEQRVPSNRTEILGAKTGFHRIIIIIMNGWMDE